MDEDTLAALLAVVQGGYVCAEELSRPLLTTGENRPGRRGRDVRSKRRKFRHDQALECIRRDYLGHDRPLFGSQFKLFFRISKARFQRLLEDVMSKDFQFYKRPKNFNPTSSCSLEAKLLLPLKTLAYGVASHCFIDYFQMSAPYARTVCLEFDKTIKALYMKEYLRLPTPNDLKSLCRLHEFIHGVQGMVGSLDCCHTYWKMCPVAWQGSYRNGKEKHPSIVLEAIADYHLFFWHASYGYSGTLNDLNILSLSPLMERLIDGSFETVEVDSGIIPFTVSGEQFKHTWITVDGIYPEYSRFVKGIKEPMNDKQAQYTKWQEAVRKDVERAFGVLKGAWQFLDRSITLHDLKTISTRVICCLILHNINVSDRVMGEVGVRYDPSYSVGDADVLVEQPPDLQEVQGGVPNIVQGGIGVQGAPEEVHELLTRSERFQQLKNNDGYQRLHAALMNRFN